MRPFIDSQADGKANVGVAVIVGVNVTVGVKVTVGVNVKVGDGICVDVGVAAGVFVHAAAVGVMEVDRLNRLFPVDSPASTKKE
ncbi:MAG: hypothetical protein IPJ46_01170 [Anaerolineales bacterium]|nr:hypothetical protein [Anaerolineales bacterium]